ncbi:hypothetical protein [Mycobacterium lepromatosis]|uniref:hypothetical protein n=1 Tax=Mycobacterium lepromatosis TaxID=480418 RepID=UPI000AA5E0E5|nr:hypothetical protein [Mycobacterium lepromatosis]UKN41416.1 hypothetical protein MLPF_0010 [Mycobacterium lepromatosis]
MNTGELTVFALQLFGDFITNTSFTSVVDRGTHTCLLSTSISRYHGSADYPNRSPISSYVDVRRRHRPERTALLSVGNIDLLLPHRK